MGGKEKEDKHLESENKEGESNMDDSTTTKKNGGLEESEVEEGGEEEEAGRRITRSASKGSKKGELQRGATRNRD